ncbi:M16 family metallopeptidase [Meiothermus ruber]|uniref:Peptidase M16 domain protein n=1 Tax=Meiothermus ruber (strain ATCC 35948 / DSM 1279 / VKM B-1258 / 21) TaxID=504728 RepID=A0A806DII1_MEIRD|nr:pitrilysin family protein [Meiothermus ruber]ADD28359.1 peptidase M16 domain protein [Meiothermus ruber DSM 1279]MCL6529037.1 insulinase family protein [Meiothermus ruber]GAO75314.1 peptidase M16 domain-containing protein [Meiothermus ruber H328]GIW39096.1 MAG: peptidase M16 [Meiothermus sp.]
MKAIWSLLLALLTLGLAQGVPADWPDPFKMQFQRLQPTAIQPTRVQLSNGLTVLLIEDRSLPFVNGRIYLRAGSIYEPEDKVGLSGIFSAVMRTGGAGDRTPDQVDETLETLAASVSVSTDNLFTSVAFNTLTENLDQVLQIWVDVLLRPRFAQDRVDLEKGRALEAIRRRNDQPTQIAVREFVRRINEGHPAGRISSTASIQSITRDDLLAFHQRFFKPNGAVLAVTGDFNTQEMVARLERTLQGWARGEVSLPTFAPPSPKPGIYFVQKETNQSVIYMGNPTVTAFAPGYSELDLASRVLGDGFNSRLFLEVRTKRGLAYATGGAQTQGFGWPGFFYGASISRVEKTAEVIELMLAQFRDLRQRPVSQEELELFRNNILNAEVFRFTSKQAVAERIARTQLLGLPDDYYEQYVRQIQAATPADLQRVMQQYVRPEQFVIVVVGDQRQFDKPLSSLGNVIEVPLE